MINLLGDRPTFKQKIPCLRAEDAKRFTTGKLVGVSQGCDESKGEAKRETINCY